MHLLCVNSRQGSRWCVKKLFKSFKQNINPHLRHARIITDAHVSIEHLLSSLHHVGSAGPDADFRPDGAESGDVRLINSFKCQLKTNLFRVTSFHSFMYFIAN